MTFQDPQQVQTPIRFRSDIQGLRALAIIPVVLFHAAASVIPGGFVGVDVFFVISGFLITRILLRESEVGNLSIVGFYARRIRRLFPALFLTLAATFLAGWMLMPPGMFAELGKGATATALFVANVFFFRQGDYFAAAAEFRPLLHTWTLAVEEQFYIVFPLLLLALRSTRRTTLALIFAGLGLVSFLLNVAIVDRDAQAVFYLPMFRIFEFVAGGTIATGALPQIQERRIRDAVSLAGLGLLVGSFLLIDETMAFPGWVGLLPVAGTGLVIYSGLGAETLAGRIIGGSVLGFVGAISYSLYLWHWPVLVMARIYKVGELDLAESAAAVTLSVLLAWLTYRFVERPVLRAEPAAWKLFMGAFAAVAFTAGAGLAVISNAGFPGRFDAGTRAYFAAEEDVSSQRENCHFNFDRKYTYADTCVLGDLRSEPHVAVFGDSFGVELAAALAERLEPRRASLRQVTASSCPPVFYAAPPSWYRCERHSAAMLAALKADPEIYTVILAGNYLDYAAQFPALAHRLRDTALELRRTGKAVVIVRPIPTLAFPGPAGTGLLARYGRDPRSLGLGRSTFESERKNIDHALMQIAKETGAATIDPAQVLCDMNRCRALSEEGQVLYFDDIHISLAAARLIWRANPTVVDRLAAGK